MAPSKLTGPEFDALLEAHGYEAGDRNMIAGWLDRGDGAAVYVNHDLGHAGLGDSRILSFGSDRAQLTTDTPPEVCPDFPGLDPGWRYVLYATYRRPVTGS